MVTLNCAALPPTLIEAELFGREKGAYTGALTRQAGRFELAHGSTIFLDEIAELPLELQVKLLRVLENGQLERIGSTKTLTVDVRVIAATNRDLAAAGRPREVPRGPLLPPECLPDRRAAAPGARRGHSAARLDLRQAIRPGARQARGAHSPGDDGRAPALPLAGQHPGAAERDRARGHPQRELDPPGAGGGGRRARVRPRRRPSPPPSARRSWPRWSRPAGASAARPAPPRCSASSPPPSSPASRSSASSAPAERRLPIRPS